MYSKLSALFTRQGRNTQSTFDQIERVFFIIRLRSNIILSTLSPTITQSNTKVFNYTEYCDHAKKIYVYTCIKFHILNHKALLRIAKSLILFSNLQNKYKTCGAEGFIHDTMMKTSKTATHCIFQYILGPSRLHYIHVFHGIPRSR